MEHVYLARQPIMDTKEHVFAYELLYRDVNKQSDVVNGRHASASVISNVLNKFGTSSLLGGRKAFVKIDEKFLMSDLIFSIPKEFFIFSLLDEIAMNERVVERIEQLYDKEYMVSINDITCTNESFQKYLEVLDWISFVKVNIPEHIGNKEVRSVIELFKSHGVKIVGTRIEEKKHAELALAMGCDYLQGYYFAQPNIIENKKIDASYLAVMKLYKLLMHDTNIDEITKEFENNYAITVQLLQFINSGAFHFRQKISSIHHVLVLMGRKPLAQWLMLMIYSKSVTSSNETSPLMLLVKSRTELMENFLKLIDPKAGSNALGEAYFVGVLSLIDVLFGVAKEEILAHMNISDEVSEAILHDAGIYGELYALVREIEAFNTQEIKNFAFRHELSNEQVREVIMKSIENVNSFDSLGASN
jgi:EAL and modified HD-GYP domain-containing signal transduction protein